MDIGTSYCLGPAYTVEEEGDNLLLEDGSNDDTIDYAYLDEEEATRRAVAESRQTMIQPDSLQVQIPFSASLGAFDTKSYYDRLSVRLKEDKYHDHLMRNAPAEIIRMIARVCYYDSSCELYENMVYNLMYVSKAFYDALNRIRVKQLSCETEEQEEVCTYNYETKWQFHQQLELFHKLKTKKIAIEFACDSNATVEFSELFSLLVAFKYKELSYIIVVVTCRKEALAFEKMKNDLISAANPNDDCIEFYNKINSLVN